MDVNAYLGEIIHDFDVERLEMVFDLQNIGDLLDANETDHILKSTSNVEKKKKSKRRLRDVDGPLNDSKNGKGKGRGKGKKMAKNTSNDDEQGNKDLSFFKWIELTENDPKSQASSTETRTKDDQKVAKQTKGRPPKQKPDQKSKPKPHFQHSSGTPSAKQPPKKKKSPKNVYQDVALSAKAESIIITEKIVSKKS